MNPLREEKWKGLIIECLFELSQPLPTHHIIELALNTLSISQYKIGANFHNFIESRFFLQNYMKLKFLMCNRRVASDTMNLYHSEGITLRKKDLSDRKNFESLLVEEAENLIGESLFKMIKIGVGFKWFAWVRPRNDISRNFAALSLR